MKLYVRPLLPAPKKRESERLTERALTDELGLPPIEHTTDGAPIIPGCHISVSHNATHLVLAIDDAPLGVDIEHPSERLSRVIGRVSAPEEEGIDPLHLWTAKEAVFKAACVPHLTIGEVRVDPSMRFATAAGRRFALQFSPGPDNSLIAIARNDFEC